MSQRNVDIVIGTFEAVNRRDFAAAFDAYADDITLVIHGEQTAASGEGAEGKEAVGAWFGDWFRTFERDYRFEVHQARDCGARVFIAATHHGRGRASGAPMEREQGWVCTLRDDRIVRCEIYPDPQQALEAAGLSGR